MAGMNGLAIKRAVHARLAAATELQDVQVDRHLDEHVTAHDYVFFGELEFDHRYVTLGGGPRRERDETCYLHVYVDVWNHGNDLDAVEDRAVEIGRVLEELLAEDPGLDHLPGLVYGGVASGEFFYETGVKGRVGVSLVYRLMFESRLT